MRCVLSSLEVVGSLGCGLVCDGVVEDGVASLVEVGESDDVLLVVVREGDVLLVMAEEVVVMGEVGMLVVVVGVLSRE